MSAKLNQEQRLSDLADRHEREDAGRRGVTVAQLRQQQSRCRHRFVNQGLYDECEDCGEPRA